MRREIVGGRVREVGTSLPQLRAWRQQRLWTQDELAERAGLKRATIIRAENGATVSAKSARAIAEALSTSIEALQQAPEGE